MNKKTIRRLIALLSLTFLPFIHCFSQNTEVGNKTVKGIFVDSRDNKKYKTIKIGSQIKFGALYSWEFANKLAPPGWRLPTDADWQQLEKEIGINKESVNTIGWRGTNNEVKKLKQDDKTGFNVVFGGWKSDYGEFKFQEQHANFWCADSYDNERAFERLIGVKNEKIGREYGNKGCGFSVRYIKESDTKK